MIHMEPVWAHLTASPLTWLSVTLVAYTASLWIAGRFDNSPLANSVLISAAIIIPVLLLTRTPYPTYLQGANLIHFLLGPATTSLAIPLFANRAAVKRSLLPIAVALVAGSLTAVGSSLLVATLFGTPVQVLASLAPKSVSAPIAMDLAQGLGGIPAVAAVIVVFTGITGAVVVTPMMNALRIHNYPARGFAVGIAAHGIGTARALQVSGAAGAFSGTAMALNGVFTAVLFLIFFSTRP
ncbi:LrgB family protein [Devosia sp. RR2S18]|uniref:LrgB family protein n=1 Tax=Devosia rhizosphaerae TaxID=3049774 RepID=UPI0025400126|nr:LrgB family protein [Devosia sp. RR2S18]WIJ26997.1 LrgB family protein [Devosia sp. RR2S18]